MKLVKITLIIAMLLLAVSCSTKDERGDNLIITLQTENKELKETIDELKLEIQALNDKENKDIDKNNYQPYQLQDTVVGYEEGHLRYAPGRGTQYYTLISDENSFYDEGEMEVLDFSGEKDARIGVTVFGRLTDFKVSKIEWNDYFTVYNEVEIVCDIKEIENKDVLFYSGLYETWPAEVVSWKNNDGKKQSLFINFNGYGFSKEVILCDNYISD